MDRDPHHSRVDTGNFTKVGTKDSQSGSSAQNVRGCRAGTFVENNGRCLFSMDRAAFSNVYGCSVANIFLCQG